jgi:hypothetical protein
MEKNITYNVIQISGRYYAYTFLSNDDDELKEFRDKCKGIEKINITKISSEIDFIWEFTIRVKRNEEIEKLMEENNITQIGNPNLPEIGVYINKIKQQPTNNLSLINQLDLLDDAVLDMGLYKAHEWLSNHKKYAIS